MVIDREVLARIPQRPPFLWVDRITGEDQDSLTAEVEIARDLYLFAGHFPKRPVLPGVIITESLVQAGALLLAGRGERGEPVLARIRSARFRREVLPGDLLCLAVRLLAVDGGFFTIIGRAEVAGKRVANCEFVCTMRRPNGDDVR